MFPSVCTLYSPEKIRFLRGARRQQFCYRTIYTVCLRGTATGTQAGHVWINGLTRLTSLPEGRRVYSIPQPRSFFAVRPGWLWAERNMMPYRASMEPDEHGHY